MTDPAELTAQLRSGLAPDFDVERELGRGGMAVVYLARDLRHEREVAVKVLRPEVASTVGSERFLREIRTAAQLVHPHILPLYESGETQGLLYYVMPYLQGRPLSARLERQGSLPIREALRIAFEIADALGYAHAKGIIHRDVKPENVLLTEGPRACLADFGLASACRSTSDQRLTVAGMMIGSPLYVSPEQIHGAGGLDGRSDVYGLGCMLFEMLAGHPPFRGATMQAVLHRHLLDPPPALSRLRPGVRGDLEALVNRAMEKDPQRRPTAESMREMLGELLHGGAPVQDDESIGAGGVGHLAPARPGPTPPPIHEHSVAVLPFLLISPEADGEYLSDGIAEELINALGRVAGIRVAARTSSFAFRRTDLSIGAIGARLGVRAVIEGSVAMAAGRLRVGVRLFAVEGTRQLWSASFERELDDLFAVQEELARAVAIALLGKLDRASERVLRYHSTEESEAYNHNLLGRHHWNRRTPEGFGRAVEQFRAAIALDPAYARAHAGLADAYVAMSQFQIRRPHQVLPLAETAARRALELEPLRSEAHATFAHILETYHWDWEGSERSYRQAIELDPRNATARIWLADLLTALGRFDEALLLAGSALELEPFAVPIRFQFGTQLYRARRFDDALAEFQRILEMDPAYFAAFVFLGFAHAAAGEPDRGASAVEQAIARLGALPPLLMPLGYCQARAGRDPEARSILAQLEALAARAFVPAANRAVVHGALGNRDRACELLREAVEERFGQFMFVAVDPAFDPVREDPRFSQVLSSMRLENAARRTAGPGLEEPSMGTRLIIPRIVT
jgi:eukaryotic-like serine/threonine-protein kinase